jgi:hypothetical protein
LHIQNDWFLEEKKIKNETSLLRHEIPLWPPQKQQQPQEVASAPASTNNKRGQKGKQKKIREKYKDQDDEERELRMQLNHNVRNYSEAPHIMLRDLLTQKFVHKFLVTDFGYPRACGFRKT